MSAHAEPHGWKWYWVCVAGWAAMMGAWMAAADVLGLPDFSLRCGAILVAAFPFVYYVRFTSFPRVYTNLFAFGAAVLLGTVELKLTWLVFLQEATSSLSSAYRLLIAAFLWVTVFRAFALRTVRDMVETVVPVGSILLLVLVCEPRIVAVVGTTIALLGSVAAMAAAHESTWAAPAPRVRAVSGRAAAPAASANSWPTVYLFGLVVAILAAQGFRSFDVTSALGRQLQIYMARVIARYVYQRPARYVAAEPRLYLALPAPSSNRPLFEVEAETSVNWRLGAYTEYDGRSWSPGKVVFYRSRQLGRGTWELPIPGGVGKSPKGDRLVMTVTARLPMVACIPSAFWPRWVACDKVKSPKHVRADSLGNLWVSRYIMPGDSYTVVAVRPDAGREPMHLSPAMRRACLQLPPHLPQRVVELAREVTRGRRTVSSKLSAFGNYLATTCQYDEFPPFPPRGADIVDYFLFESHRGYCLHFASAVVVMCRALGIPARLVTGFLEGEMSESTRRYVIRARDAHAWAEVFVPGQGWIEFDATPPRPLTAPELAAQTWDTMVSAIGKGLSAAWLWSVGHAGSALVMLTAIGAMWALYRRWRWAELVRVRLSGAGPRRQVRWAYQQMLKWLEDAGETVPQTATPLEIAQMLPARWGDARRHAFTVAWAFTRSLYGRSGISRAEAEEAVRAAEAFRDRWLAIRKRRGAPSNTEAPLPAGR